MHVEPATPADIPALADLLTILFAQEVEFVPDRAAQIRGLTLIVKNPEIGCILVARQQGKILGMVNLLYTISTALGERVAILEDMVVSPSARGGGIGTQLLQAAIEYARSVGCKRITLLTDQSNEIAQQFYAKQGFSISSMVPMRLAL
jgi:GNAT superfamily N-acetyltransferase